MSYLDKAYNWANVSQESINNDVLMIFKQADKELEAKDRVIAELKERLISSNCLPKITSCMIDEFMDTCLMTLDKESCRALWSQTAVDFSCILTD